VHLEWRSPDADILHSQPIVRGTVHIKAAGQQYWQRWLLPADVLVVAFDRSYFANLSREAAGYDLDFNGQLGVSEPKLSDLTALFSHELLNDGTNGRLYVESLGAALAVYLMQRRANRPAADVPHAVLVNARLRRITEYIDANLTKDLGLAELADVSGFNSHHFAHAFKAATGLSPHRYVIELRIPTKAPRHSDLMAPRVPR